MKELNLNAYDVAEMNQEEMLNKEGGIIWWVPFLAGAFAGGLIYDIVFHTGDCIDSYNRGAEAALQSR